MTELEDVIIKTIENSKDGVVSDDISKILLVSEINDSLPFHKIELTDLNHLYVMMKDSDFPHIQYFNDTSFFSAYYYHDDDYPLGRNYYIKETNLFKQVNIYKFLKESGVDITMIHPDNIEHKLQLNNCRSRVSSYYKKIEKNNPFVELFKGRKKSTTTEEGIFLNSEGCLVCGNKESFMVTTTLISTEAKIIGFKLCFEHYLESNKYKSLYSYLFKTFNQTPTYEPLPLDQNDYFNSIIDSLPKILDTKILSIKNKTITMIRASKVKIVLRLDSVENYGYMIFSPTNKQLFRIDSADHHNLNWGPDHIHKLIYGKSIINPSFTAGLPSFDIKILKSLIEEVEKKL